MPDVFEYNTSAVRYESGTRDAASVAGMAAAVRFLSDIGIDRVAERSRTLALRLQAGIRNLPGLTLLSPRTNAQGSAITTIRMAQKPYNELFSLLMREHNMRTRVVTEEDLNALRISTHIFNTEDDIDALIEALTTISAG
jgi:selenocysteine lyase/cysteine desulfurase